MSTPTVLTGNPTIQEISHDARLLYDRLKAAAVGEIVTYDELNAIIGREIRSRRSALATARRMVQRDNGIVYGTVAKVGIKRLDDLEISTSATGVLSRVRRSIRRNLAQQGLVNAQALSQPRQVEHYARISLLNTVAEFAKPGAEARIAQRTTAAQLPVGTVLAEFMR